MPKIRRYYCKKKQKVLGTIGKQFEQQVLTIGVHGGDTVMSNPLQC